jgi:hypothetical protein
MVPASVASAQGVACAGDTETISWTAPADTAGLTAYVVTDTPVNDGCAACGDFPVATVPLDQTSTTVTLGTGGNIYAVWGETADGIDYSDPIPGGASFTGGIAPQPELWAPSGTNSVGDGTATVYFDWSGPQTHDGYIGATTETVSDGNAMVTVAPDQSATFTGLTDGKAYTFTSITTNACGSTNGGSSPAFVPGVGPAWTSDSPALTAPFGLYAATFHSSGNPKPTYRLVGAPSWLQIVSSGPLAGLVYGIAPRGTTSFSYSVTAHNGVGIFAGTIYPSTDITAGPYTVGVNG